MAAEMKFCTGCVDPTTFRRRSSSVLYVTEKSARFLACWNVARRMNSSFSFKLQRITTLWPPPSLPPPSPPPLKSPSSPPLVEEKCHHQCMRKPNLDAVPARKRTHILYSNVAFTLLILVYSIIYTVNTHYDMYWNVSCSVATGEYTQVYI